MAEEPPRSGGNGIAVKPNIPRAPSQPAPMLASRYSSVTMGGFLLRDSIRIRHISQIIARNLEGESIDSPVDCYCTLAEVESKGSRTFYKSPVDCRTLNPNWQILDKLVAKGYTSTDLEIRIYVRQNTSDCLNDAHHSHSRPRPPPDGHDGDGNGEADGWKVHLKQRFKLKDLEYCQPARRHGIGGLGKSGPNTLFFVLKDGIYSFTGASRASLGPPQHSRRKAVLKITASAMLQQHQQMLSEVQNCLKAMAKRKKAEDELASLLEESEKIAAKRRQVKASLSVLAEVSKSIQAEKKRVGEGLKVVREKRDKLRPKAEMLLSLWKVLKGKRQAMEMADEMSGPMHREKLMAGTCLHLRQLRMLWFLYGIYPIVKVGNYDAKGTIRPVYTIKGVSVPDRPNDQMAKEVSVALGYCAHLIQMVSKYLNVKLRYQIFHMGSKSYVLDDVPNPPKRVLLFFKDQNSRLVIQQGIGMLIVNVLMLLDAFQAKPKQTSFGSGTTLLHHLYTMQRQVLGRK